MSKSTRNTIISAWEVPALTTVLRAVRSRIEEEAISFGFDAATAFRIALAVDEACANIIEHAYGGGRNETFNVEISRRGDSFTVTLTDHGRPFEAGPLPKLDLQMQMRRHRNGGLGLHLIEQIMDDILYRREREGCNILRLIKRLDPSS